jgi:hypothetical protein
MTRVQPDSLAFGPALPCVMAFSHKKGIWMIDQHKGKGDAPNDLLSALGNIGEKLLTVDTETFDEFRLEGTTDESRDVAAKKVKPAFAFAQVRAFEGTVVGLLWRAAW